MPAKRIILLDKKPSPAGERLTAALWVDVPSGSQGLYQNPSFVSAYQGATLAEVTALRRGQVVEQVVTLDNASGASQAGIEASLEARWTTFQNQITAEVPWTVFGRFWNGTVWANGVVPPEFLRTQESTQPTFFAMTPVQAFAANRFHFVLFNNSTYAKVRLLLLAFMPQATAVTGALSSAWSLRRRLGPTTAPAGGTFAPLAADSADVVPTGITLSAIPTTAPAGGTTEEFLSVFPQPDEIKLSTLDGPTRASMEPFAGQPLYDASKFRPAVPLLIKPNEVLELQQSATAGTGNCRIYCVFTVADDRIGGV